jgi:hypothetical protein
LKKISKEDAFYLIKEGFLKTKKGKYEDLHITSKQKKGKRKGYYVPDFLLKHINKK